MKKITVLLLAVVMAFGLVFAGCNNSKTNYSNNLSGLDGDVSSNGGFAVVKGEYVYFINGIASNTDDNTFGKPVTGALVRVKKSDLAAAADGEEETTVKTEMVIPSLFVAGDMTSGFYIYGNNVYFASPYTEKNKEGKVQNDKLSFVRASLDGKERTVIDTVDDNTTVYRYMENDGKVYLLIKTTVKDERSTSSTATRAAIVAYNAETGEKIFTSGKVSEYGFGEGEEANDVYYTVTAYDEDLKQEEKYNDVYRYVAGSEKEELVLSGKGKIKNGTETDDDNKNGIGLTGVTYSLLKNAEKTIYLKVTYVDTSVTSVVKYYALEKNDITANDGEANKAKLADLSNATANASKIFSSSSYYASKNCIIYLDTTYGLVAYNVDFENGKTFNGDKGDKIENNCAWLFYDKDLVGYTVKFWDNGYVYLTDSNNYYYRVQIIGSVIDKDGNAITGENAPEAKLEKVNFLANSTSWYLPEVVDNYFLSVYTATPYSSLVYVSDMTKNAEKTDEEIEDIRKSDKDSVNSNLSTCISIISETVQTTIDNYKKDTFGEDK